MDGDLPSLRGSPTNPGMVTHQPKDGQPPEGGVLQTWNLAITDYSRITRQPKDGHPNWPCVAQFGPVWSRLAMFGPV